MQIMVELPDELASQIAADRKELPRRLLEDAAVGAYCRDAISKQELQSMLGFGTRLELDGLLKRLGVQHGSYSGQDLLDDVAAMDARLAKESASL